MIRALRPAGEAAVIAYLGASVSEEVSDAVRALTAALDSASPAWLREVVPSYASLLVLFDPLAAEHRTVAETLRELATVSATIRGDVRTITLPAYYDPEVGPDLGALALRAGLTSRQVAERHSDVLYRVYAVGFAPGFAYLGEVHESLAAPRHPSPRRRVARGSVAIADRQTAVYPLPSPGGWNLIGRCPEVLFDPAAGRLPPFRIGDRVRFEAIDRDHYLRLGGDLP